MRYNEGRNGGWKIAAKTVGRNETEKETVAIKNPKNNQYDTTHLLVLQLLLTHILPLPRCLLLSQREFRISQMFLLRRFEGGSSTSGRKEEISI
jgi:hypothetical protein